MDILTAIEKRKAELALLESALALTTDIPNSTEVTRATLVPTTRAIFTRKPKAWPVNGNGNGNGKAPSKMEMLRTVLREAKGPMHVAQIVESIKKRWKADVTTGTLASYCLTNDKEFVKTAPNTFATRVATRRAA